MLSTSDTVSLVFGEVWEKKWRQGTTTQDCRGMKGEKSLINTTLNTLIAVGSVKKSKGLGSPPLPEWQELEEDDQVPERQALDASATRVQHAWGALPLVRKYPATASSSRLSPKSTQKTCQLGHSG